MGMNKNDATSFEEMAEEQNAQETPVAEATAPVVEPTEAGDKPCDCGDVPCTDPCDCETPKAE